MSHIGDKLLFSKEHLLVFLCFVVEAEEALVIGLFDSHVDDEFGSDAKLKEIIKCCKREMLIKNTNDYISH